jgi:hypothetical protein
MQKILHINGLCRSGNHAIIFWIMHNLTNLQIDKINSNTYHSKDRNVFFQNDTKKYVTKEDFLKYKYLIKSYEDIFLSQDNMNYIVRDFLNMISSRYKNWNDDLGPYKNDKRFSEKYRQFFYSIEEICHCWKQMIKENRKIIYNKWVIDKSYRDEISKNLFDIDNINDNTSYVSFLGKGSSFDGMKLQTDKNIYLNRFSQIKLPDYIINYIKKDNELLDLNYHYFNIDILQKIQESA